MDQEVAAIEAISKQPIYRGVDLIIKIRELNPNIVCALCAGYFIDATTITECSHTFCKSCIVKHFQTRKSCPECGQKIHETQPLNNLRSDRVMQDVVYKLVPDLFKNEQEAEANFYRSKGMDFMQSGSHLLNIGTPLKYTQQKGIRETDTNEGIPNIDVTKIPNSSSSHIMQFDEKIVIFIQMHPEMNITTKPDSDLALYQDIQFLPLLKKFIRCSSRVKVCYLKKLLECKMKPESLESDVKIQIFNNDCEVNDNVTLKKIFLHQFRSGKMQHPYIELTYKLCAHTKC